MDNATVAAVANIASAMQKLAIPKQKVPPPFMCSHVDRLPQFFKLFERYAESEYGCDPELWISVLPSFVDGEVLSLVSAFGPDVRYDHLKARVLSEFVSDTKITGKSFTNIFNLKRKHDENLRCFRIRLESLVGEIETTKTTKDALVMESLRNNISRKVLYEVDLQLSTVKYISIDKFVEVCESVNKIMLSDLADGHISRPCEKVRVANERETSVGADRSHRSSSLSHVTCYNCHERGHFANSCSSTMSKVVCYSCHSPGHVARRCPNKQPIKQSVGPASNLICGYCGVPGHPMMRCKDFMLFQQNLAGVSSRNTNKDLN